MQTFQLNKEDDRLPDSYTMTALLHGEPRAIDYEVVEHRLIDKVFQLQEVEQTNAQGEKVKKLVHVAIGIAPVPHFEYRTVKGLWGIIPLASIKSLVFDDRWSTMVAIGKEKEKKSNEAL